MPRNPTRDERVAWHEEHERECGCREVPPSLAPAVRSLRRQAKARR